MPVRAKWKRVWLGRFSDPADVGWLPLDAEVQTTDLGVFPPKVTTGDATKDSDDYLSTWIISDLTGGQGINTINEGTDTQRYWWGTADTRFNNQLALGPLVTETAPTGTSGFNMPLGDVPGAAGNPTTYYHLWGATPYGYNDSAASWYSAATAFAATPTGMGIAFRGTSAATKLYVPLGSYGYGTIVESGAGTATVTSNVKSTTKPGAVLLCNQDTRLFALDNTGVLWVTADGTAWDKILRPEADSSNTNQPLTFDLAETPLKLISYLDRAGDPALCLVTNRSLWMFDEYASSWVRTNVRSNHPDFGLDAEVWRVGEDLWMAQGMDVIRLTSAFVVVPFSGLARDDSVPREYRGRIVALASEPGNLWMATEPSPNAGSAQSFIDERGFFADDPIYVPSDETYATLSAWSGTGWAPLWTASDGGFLPSRLAVSALAHSAHKLWMGGNDGLARFLPLKYDFMPPKQAREIGIDSFAKASYIETGWFDAGMLAFQKKASHVIVDCEYATSSERVTISYKTETDADWIPLGSATSPGLTSLTFTDLTDEDGAGFSTGLAFYRMKLRIDLAQGATPQATPIVSTVNLMFVKIPQNTKSFVFTVPLPKRRWQGKTAGEIREHLVGLMTAGEFLKFVHQDRVYRVTVAGISGTDDTAEDRSGNRRVNLVAIPTGVNTTGNA